MSWKGRPFNRASSQSTTPSIWPSTHQEVPHPEVAVHADERKRGALEVEPPTGKALEELLLHVAPTDLTPVPRPDAIHAGIDRHAVDAHLAGRRRPLKPLQPSLCGLKVMGDPTRVTRMARRVVPGGHRLTRDRRLDEHELTRRRAPARWAVGAPCIASGAVSGELLERGVLRHERGLCARAAGRLHHGPELSPLVEQDQRHLARVAVEAGHDAPREPGSFVARLRAAVVQPGQEGVDHADLVATMAIPGLSATRSGCGTRSAVHRPQSRSRCFTRAVRGLEPPTYGKNRRVRK